MQPEQKAIEVARRFLKAVELPVPTTPPQSEPIGVGAVLLHWPSWTVLVERVVGSSTRVLSVQRGTQVRVAPIPILRTESYRRARALRFERALALPGDCHVQVNTERELTWERPTPGSYPFFDRRRLSFQLHFSPTDGQLTLGFDHLHQLDAATLPPLTVRPEAAREAAQALLSFAKRPAEAPSAAPELAWTPFLGELTPQDAEMRFHAPQTRGGGERGPLRLAWVVRWSWCTVGVDPTTGKPSYFQRTYSSIR